MELDQLILELLAIRDESPVEGQTPVCLALPGIPHQGIGSTLLDQDNQLAVAILELRPDSLVHALLDTELHREESQAETVNHLRFIRTLAQTFMANSGELSPEVREALGELGRCADFRTLTEVAVASATYRRDTDGTELPELAGKHTY